VKNILFLNEVEKSILNRLLAIGLKQIQDGEIRTREEVMADIKLKYKWNI
jgi:predicted transcriptional regulator